MSYANRIPHMPATKPRQNYKLGHLTLYDS